MSGYFNEDTVVELFILNVAVETPLIFTATVND